jgi:hypothetical protein
VADLLVLGVAGDQEHFSGDALDQHLLPSDAIVAESQEDPRNIGLDDHVILVVGILKYYLEEVQHPLFNENGYGLLIESEVDQSQSAELLHL